MPCPNLAHRDAMGTDAIKRILLDQSDAQGLGNGLGAIDGVELLGGAIEVVIDRMFRERQDFGNFRTGLPGRRPV